MSAMGHAAVLVHRSALRFGCALGLTLGTAALAQAQTGTVIGTITDRGTGQPIDAARAVIVGTALAAASDTRGTFMIRGLRAGSYTVRVSRIGFRPEVAAVSTARFRSMSIWPECC